MKRVFLGIAVLLVFGMMTASAMAGKDGNGNGFLSGPHYNLNIIAKSKNMDVGDTPNRHTLFVKENGKTKIIMQQTQDADDDNFKVLDPDGTDGTAKFELAAGYYNVFARALGKPNKSVDITAWGEFDDAELGDTLIWLGAVNLTRDKGQKPQAVNINELFYVTVSVCTSLDDGPDGTGLCDEWTVYEDYWVFDIDELLEYFWDYDNHGLKLLQVRFYPCELAADPENPTGNYCMWPDGSAIDPFKDVVDEPPDNWPGNPAPGRGVSSVVTTWGDIKSNY